MIKCNGFRNETPVVEVVAVVVVFLSLIFIALSEVLKAFPNQDEQLSSCSHLKGSVFGSVQ